MANKLQILYVYTCSHPRWEDAVQRDSLQILGTWGWRRRAENRDEWRHLLREAKVRKGL
jgi:hypothetical protein